MNKEEKCKELLEKVKQTPDSVIEDAIDSLSEKMNKEKNLGDYWKGYIEKQIEAVEICKICKYRKRYKELEQKESILDKVTNKLKEYLKLLKQDGIYGYDIEIKEILNIIEGEKK